MSWNVKYGLLILLTTVVTYACGLSLSWVGRRCAGRKRADFGKECTKSPLNVLQRLHMRAVQLHPPDGACTDVLVWWGHMVHDRVPDEIVDRVQRHILSGMGLVVLHSGRI